MKIVDQFYQCSVSVPSSVFPEEVMTWQLRCYVQIFFRSSGEQVVLMSDLGCEMSWFVPQRLELLATQIAKEFQLNPDRLIWIEHDPAGIGTLDSSNLGTELSQVLFQWEGGKARNPQWYDLSAEMVIALKQEMWAKEQPRERV